MYIKQKNTNTVIITDSQNLSNHPSIINNPDIYEIVEGEIPENASFMHYVGVSKVDIYEEKVKELFTYLMNRALSSSMGKYGTYEYLQIQRDEYFLKYKVAKGFEENQPIADAIVKEMERDFPTPMLDAILTSYGQNDLNGTQLEKMYALIVIRYEYANSRLQNYQGKSIDFRTKCRTLIELGQWSILDDAFALAESLPNELTDEQIDIFYNKFSEL